MDRLYPSAPLEKNDIKQQLEKKFNYVNGSINYINNIKEMITYIKDKNHNTKKNYKENKRLTTTIESFDPLVIFATTSCSIALSLTGMGFDSDIKIHCNTMQTIIWKKGNI